MPLYINYSFAQAEVAVCKTLSARNSNEKKSDHGITAKHSS